jgi:hypothetical protein
MGRRVLGDGWALLGMWAKKVHRAGVNRVGKGSGSFLKKRTKKILSMGSGD